MISLRVSSCAEQEQSNQGHVSLQEDHPPHSARLRILVLPLPLGSALPACSALTRAPQACLMVFTSKPRGLLGPGSAPQAQQVPSRSQEEGCSVNHGWRRQVVGEATAPHSASSRAPPAGGMMPPPRHHRLTHGGQSRGGEAGAHLSPGARQHALPLLLCRGGEARPAGSSSRCLGGPQGGRTAAPLLPPLTGHGSFPASPPLPRRTPPSPHLAGPPLPSLRDYRTKAWGGSPGRGGLGHSDSFSRPRSCGDPHLSCSSTSSLRPSPMQLGPRTAGSEDKRPSCAVTAQSNASAQDHPSFKATGSDGAASFSVAETLRCYFCSCPNPPSSLSQTWLFPVVFSSWKPSCLCSGRGHSAIHASHLTNPSPAISPKYSRRLQILVELRIL